MVGNCKYRGKSKMKHGEGVWAATYFLVEMGTGKIYTHLPTSRIFVCVEGEVSSV